MRNPDKNYIHAELTEMIIGCAYKVHNELGAGFLEKVYENSLLIELNNTGLSVQQQYPIKVYYNGIVVGDYYADLVVEEKIIVEVKALGQLTKAHQVQLVNYLKATSLKVGLLINFGDKVSIKRKVLSQK